MYALIYHVYLNQLFKILCIKGCKSLRGWAKKAVSFGVRDSLVKARCLSCFSRAPGWPDHDSALGGILGQAMEWRNYYLISSRGLRSEY